MTPRHQRLALLALRRAARLSQGELALRARLAQQTISDLERGARHGRVGTWRRIAAVLDLPVEMFDGRRRGRA